MKNNFLSLRAMFLSFLLITGMAAFAQVAVQGTVTDAANGEPIIGASVLEIGTTNGTITDFDGNFSLTVKPGATLAISYMGYKTQELAAAPSMSVRLGEDSELLDEVVVVGYGVVKKNDATGSVTAIKPDDMNKGLQTTATDMLSGKIAGVAVTTNDGTPGGGATIRIRGGSSLNASNDPLIVIDGLAMDNDGVKGVANPLAMVNPADIESFTVPKDASATAIYGSRASNGVIIITTKKGAANQKLKVSYNGNVSFGTLLNTLDVFSGEELRDYAQQLYNDKVMYPDTYRPKVLNFLGDANTNWQRQIYRTAISTDHNVSLMGGTKNMPYRFSLGYTDQNGIIKTSNMQRVTASLNLNPSFLDKHLVFNINAKGMYIYNRYNPGVVGSAVAYDPTVPVKGEATGYLTGTTLGASQAVLDQIFGGYFGRTQPSSLDDSEWQYQFNTQTASNPVNQLAYTNDRAHSGSFVGNAEVDYKIHGFEDLHIHANFGADYSYGKQTTNIDRHIQDVGNGYYGYYGYVWEKKYNLSFNAYAQYYKDFSEHQHFDIMVGGEYQKFHRNSYNEGWKTYPQTNNNPELRGTKKDYSDYTYATQSALLSFFGRANWVGWNQVMATVTLRADASTRFAPDVRWGLFPSVALGWKIKETFLKDVHWLNDLKLRLGYGITGQQNVSDAFQYLPVFAQNQTGAWSTLGETAAQVDLSGKEEGIDYVIGNDGYVYYMTYRPNEYNPGLTWEKTTTFNAGIDFAFLNNRISGSLDYYYRITNDLINWVDIPAGSNFKTRVIRNVGSLTNQGVEFSINAVAIDTKNFKWDLGYNVGWNDNKIRNLTGSDDPGYYEYNTGSGIGNGAYVQANAVGHAANSFYVYESKTNPNTGLLYLVDQDHPDALPDDPSYDLEATDKIFYHSAAAPVSMGFNTKFQFYGVDLGITLRANIGNYVYNSVLQYQLQYVTTLYDAKFDGFHNVLRQAYTAYYDDGCHLRNELGDGRLSTYFVQKASFLRCDNITLGYSFAPKTTTINGRVYCTVSNPFVISGYKGLDPEIAGGIDYNMYPRCMTTVIGLSLNF